MPQAQAPPILDFSAFYGNDAAKKKQLVDDVRRCCLHNGFFQITGHPVPIDLQEGIMKWSKRFFNLPLEEKMKVSKDTTNTWNRGYELLRSQILEPGTLPELKEGFYIGDEIEKSHPYFVHKKLNSGPNIWPEPSPPKRTSPDTANANPDKAINGTDHFSPQDVQDFKTISMTYYHAVTTLATHILSVLALTLSLPESHFDPLTTASISTMRLLHYPTQPPDSPHRLTRGIGAHTDFGTITLLLQDTVPGLQVWEKGTGEWIDVEPVKNAFVVNLGNLMQRWTNDRYVSNLHRVINVSGEERYSVPLFFSGNPDFVVECLPGCRGDDGPKYGPITVEEAVSGGYKESYGRAERFKKEGMEERKGYEGSMASEQVVAG